MPSVFIFIFIFIFSIVFVYDCVQSGRELWFSWADWPLWPILLRNTLRCEPIFIFIFSIVFVYDCVQSGQELWFSWADWPLWPILLRNTLRCEPITLSFPDSLWCSSRFYHQMINQQTACHAHSISSFLRSVFLRLSPFKENFEEKKHCYRMIQKM